ncbi:hypothetical protein I4U23_025287 [Adineta vaga]|nr:hypothetical protein I4U23_025287 [Adineta vaga]
MKSINSWTLTTKNSICFSQITSLIIEQVDVKFDELESFLLLIPKLYYLKLIGREDQLDGKRLENFIQFNLPYLDRFEFFFDIFNSSIKAVEDLQLFFSTFQTLFWIEYKKWFINCESTISYPRLISIYSIPICKSSYKYSSTMTCLSTCNRNNSSSTMENIDTIEISFKESMSNEIPSKRDYSQVSRGICFVIPSHIKHLQMPVANLHQLRIIVGRCQNLSVFKIQTMKSQYVDYIIGWFTLNTIDSICRKQCFNVSVWIGKKPQKFDQMKNKNKRMKLTYPRISY